MNLCHPKDYQIYSGFQCIFINVNRYFVFRHGFWLLNKHCGSPDIICTYGQAI